MRRIYASMICRTPPGADPPPAEDYVYIIDWDTAMIYDHLRMPHHDDGTISSRSGVSTHGTRGLAIDADRMELYVAGSGQRISVFDLRKGPPTFSRSFHVEGAQAIHQIRFRDGLLYVVSTGNDLLLKLRGEEVVDTIRVRDRAGNVGGFVPPYDARRPGEDKYHFNSIGWGPSGEMYHVYMGPQVLYDFDARRVVPTGGALASPHDVVSWHELLVVNSSADLCTLAVKPDTSLRVVHKGYGRPTGAYASLYGYTRGLVVAGDRLICGSAPLGLHEFEYADGQFYRTRSCLLLTDPAVAVYDLALDPRDWSP